MNSLSLVFTSGNIWLFFVSLLLGIAFSNWTYRRTVPKTSPSRRRLLITLRSLALALLLFVLFEPILTFTKTNELTPRIALVLDNSKSMRLPQSGSDTSDTHTRRAMMVANIPKVFGSNTLSDATKVRAFAFDERMSALGGTSLQIFDTLKATASVTDISSIFSALSEQQKSENYGAIVLYTDGAYTAGANPIYAAEKLGIPVYAVGLGDSSEVRDIALAELFTNDVASVNVGQPVDVTIHAVGSKSGDRVTVTLMADDLPIGEQSLSMTEGRGDYTTTFSFLPKTEGIVKLTAKVIPTDASTDANSKNNVKISYVRVLKNKFKIILFAGAPSPDVSFISDYFSSHKEIEYLEFIQKQGEEFYHGAPTAEKVKDADLIILSGFPIASSSNESIALIRKLIVEQSKSLLFIPSRMLDFDKLKPLAEALPFSLNGMKSSTNELKVFTSLSSNKGENPIFRASREQTSQTKWENLAPLIKTETHYTANPESEVLAEATVQGIKLGEPLVISRTVGKSRQIAFTAYGLWQWKLTSFGREKAFASLSRKHDSTAASESALDIFLANSTRWLVTRDDQKRVMIAPTRKIYDAGEPIEFSGQIYDESYVPIDGAMVTVSVTGKNLAAPLPLTLTSISNGRYSARLPQGLAAGDYFYKGEARLGTKELGTDAGRFNVGEYSPEFAEPRMRSDILREMAARTNGKFYVPENTATVLKDIESNPNFRAKKIDEKTDFEGRNMWPLLLVAVALFSTEWFIRKRTGML
ncbi:MAG: CARDB domain-containing protein [bacterium]